MRGVRGGEGGGMEGGAHQQLQAQTVPAGSATQHVTGTYRCKI